MKIPQKTKYRTTIWGCSNGSRVKNLPVIVGDTGLISDPERFHILGSDLAHVPQLFSCNYWVHMPQLQKPTEVGFQKPLCSCSTREATTMRSQWKAHELHLESSTRFHQLEKCPSSNKDPAETKINKCKLKK